MTISRRALSWFYIIIAILAGIGTWGNILNMDMVQLGFINGTIQFWQDTLLNPVSEFLAVDVFFFGLAASVWMLFEAHRLELHGVWFFIIFGILIGFGVTFSLFMFYREKRLALLVPSEAAGNLNTVDIIGLAILTIVSIVYAVVTLQN